jgi:hypothetical protein
MVGVVAAWTIALAVILLAPGGNPLGVAVLVLLVAFIGAHYWHTTNDR